jgi:hypothetical protein
VKLSHARHEGLLSGVLTVSDIAEYAKAYSENPLAVTAYEGRIGASVSRSAGSNQLPVIEFVQEISSLTLETPRAGTFCQDNSPSHPACGVRRLEELPLKRRIALRVSVLPAEHDPVSFLLRDEEDKG